MIYIASDHAGFELKKKIIEHLQVAGQKVEDCGPASYNKVDDYPDFIIPCAEKVAASHGQGRGIVLGFSGNGEAIAANKVKGVRAAVYYGGDRELIRLSRDHNDANVLSLGAGFIPDAEVISVIDQWLSLPFSNDERHLRRIRKISEFEQK